MFNILVAEDDTNTRKWLAAVLRTNGFNPILAEDGQAALDLLDHYPVDLLIADIMMPNLDGLNLTRQLRASGSTLPVLMLTALQMPENKRQGFLVGTDDYMVKPVDDEEMILRIRALLRRARIVSERRLTIGPVILDYDALSVSREGQSQTLPQKEFFLLFKLLSYPDVIFTRLQLMDEIWGMDSETDDRTVNVHINRLRERFGSWPEFEIVTIRGLGYKAVKRL